MFFVCTETHLCACVTCGLVTCDTIDLAESRRVVINWARNGRSDLVLHCVVGTLLNN